MWHFTLFKKDDLKRERFEHTQDALLKKHLSTAMDLFFQNPEKLTGA